MTGSADTPILEDIQACAVRLDDLPDGASTLYRALGSNAARNDFAPILDKLGEKADVRFGPSGGRSSDTTALPFFNIAASGRGIMAAVGWSGKWKAAVKRTRPSRGPDGRNGQDAFSAPAREKRSARPRSPCSFGKGMTAWTATISSAGSSSPITRLGSKGKPVELPLSHGVGFGGPFPCNEYVCATESYALAMIDRLKQFGIEPDACWIDAGWYENATKNWWPGVGNWTVNKANFPRGLKPVTDAARRWGKGFVLWFEPERVYEGTRLDREHPGLADRASGQFQPPAQSGQSQAP